MRRHAIRAVILAVVLVCLLTPVAELFDGWDNTLQSGNDVESNLAMVAVCLGAALMLTGILSKILRGSGLSANVSTPQQWHPPVLAIPLHLLSPPSRSLRI